MKTCENELLHVMNLCCGFYPIFQLCAGLLSIFMTCSPESCLNGWFILIPFFTAVPSACWTCLSVCMLWHVLTRVCMFVNACTLYCRPIREHRSGAVPAWSLLSEMIPLQLCWHVSKCVLTRAHVYVNACVWMLCVCRPSREHRPCAVPAWSQKWTVPLTSVLACLKCVLTHAHVWACVRVCF